MEALKKVEQLKERQDADYYLTSLLITPLSKNLVQSPYLSVEFFIRQKKKFQFRDMNGEIGGDVNAARMIRLQGRNYAVIANADAMGKSMQGAMGSLVFASVFHAIIKRTQNVKSMQDLPPELWLRDAFRELDEVFIGFDYKMLISILISLVDEQTGFMYFMEAEHPRLALYRNNEASYIESEFKNDKLGMDLKARELYVETFQLLPGDAVIYGSDGRDDVEIKEGEKKYIQMDPCFFLERVREGQGELPLIFSSLESKGRITDDLSLIRLSYTGIGEEDFEKQGRGSGALNVNGNRERAQFSETSLERLRQAVGENVENLETAALLLDGYIQAGLFEPAATLAEQIVKFHPDRPEFLTIAWENWKKAGHYEAALEAAERFYIRGIKDEENLMTLASLNLRDKNLDRARAMLDEILRLNPRRPDALELRENLNGNSRVP